MRDRLNAALVCGMIGCLFAWMNSNGFADPAIPAAEALYSSKKVIIPGTEDLGDAYKDY